MPKGVFDRTLSPGFVPVSNIDWLVQELVIRYRTPRLAGDAYDRRFRPRPGSGYRLLCRIKGGEVETITWNTLDRLKTLAAS